MYTYEELATQLISNILLLVFIAIGAVICWYLNTTGIIAFIMLLIISVLMASYLTYRILK